MTNEIVAAINLCGAFVIAVLMIETTKTTKDSCGRNDGQSFWALLRRIVYGAVAIALFAVAVLTLEANVAIPPGIAFAWCVVLIALIFFPAVRAAGLIDQDRWVGFRRR